jgi:preprotein translocase subunit SecG
MKELILVIHVLTAVGLVALVLVQQSKGADIGAAFGSGASQTLFGARGSANFLTRLTALLATIFFVTSLTLAVLATRGGGPRSVTDTVTSEPVAPATAPPAEKQAPPPAKTPQTPADVPAVPR